MARVYYLEIERTDNIDAVKGIKYIHHAILLMEGSLRKLIQDTTEVEHAGLIAVAVSWREATANEAALLETLPPPAPPDSPDVVTLKEYLANPHSGLPDLETAFQALARLCLERQI